MDINNTVTVTKTAEISNNPPSSNATATKESSTKFKDELKAAKIQDVKTPEDIKTEETKAVNEIKPANEIKVANEKIPQEIAKEKLQNKEDKTKENIDNAKVSDPLKELTSQIATIKGIKNGQTQNTIEHFELKVEEKSTDKKDYCATLKMDNQDINFFLNLVENQQMTAQIGQLNNSGATANNNNFNEIKTEAAKQTVTVSATLLDAINESVKTNKPFRIDFGNDVAVIMRVNKDGNLSANFIPGNAAVEQYLRNNIESLRQSFNEQNLPYERLSYSKHQDQNQKQNQKNNKENENE